MQMICHDIKVIRWFLLCCTLHITPQTLNELSYTVSDGQKLGAAQLNWLRVTHDIAVRLPASASVIGRFIWGWRICFQGHPCGNWLPPDLVMREGGQGRKRETKKETTALFVTSSWKLHTVD